MSAETLLQRLDKVRQTRPNNWKARCPAHDDHGPSLAIRELEDGRVLLHCFAGCSVADVLDAIGIDFAELYPAKPPANHAAKPLRKPWNPIDILTALAVEGLIILQCANKIARGEALSNADREQLLLAVSRWQRGLEVISE